MIEFASTEANDNLDHAMKMRRQQEVIGLKWESPGLVSLGASAMQASGGEPILCNPGSGAGGDCKTGPNPGGGCANGNTAIRLFCSDGGGLPPP